MNNRKFSKRKKNAKQIIDKNTLKPIKSLKGKNNYKRYFRIEWDGTIKERIFLNIPNISLREEIILKHCLMFLAENFLQSPIGINLINRDKPWDFRVELSNGLSFNVEITSIAEEKWLFEKMKREEEFEKACMKEKLKVRDLKKINLWFRSEKSNQLIKRLERESVDADKFIENPFFRENTNIFLSYSKDEKESLSDLVMRAIEGKNNKSHKDKEDTVLIIDNRTSRFEIEDYQKAVTELEDKLAGVVFPEIYFYTGYYSNNDGNNAEYSFAPIKLPDKMCKQIEKRIESGELTLDKSGIAYSKRQKHPPYNG